MRSRVVIATRGSELARWQSNWIAGRLREVHPGLEVELMVLRTSGDRFQEASLQAIGGKGAFTKEITEAVLARSADLAVHSLKDLPTRAEPGLAVWAYPPRFDVRDAWFGRDGRPFSALKAGDVVASGSLRRSAQLLHHHPGVRVEPIRGNLDTRLRKFEEGTMTGMFLALAGLQRLELADRITEALDPSLFLPAPGQGALAVEGRADAGTEALLSPLDDADTRDRVTAERGLLAELEAGCQVPVGALARIEGPELVLEALVASLDGATLFRDERRGPREHAAEIGRSLARELLDRGGREILDAIREISS